jgi:hypothetical protein
LGKIMIKLTLTAAAVLMIPVLSASTITFDESPAPDTGTPYGATILGATFSATNGGIWGGNSQGNPGSWGLEGTNGPQFLGFNGSPYSETVTFASAVNGFSADFSRSDGSTDGAITLSAFNGATQIDTTTVALGAINTWSTVSLSDSGITSVTWSDAGTGFHPYGVDNLVFGTSAVPEPGSLLLAALGFLVLVAASCRAMLLRA